MSTFKPRPSGQNWLRFAMKLGLLATDAALWSSLARMLSERDDARDPLRPRQRLAVDLQARRGWSRAATLLTGVGVGVGLGLVFAPMSGEQARLAIRDKVLTIRNTIEDVADWAGRRSSFSRRSTGTYAD